MKTTSDIPESLVKRMLAIIVLSMLLIVPALPMVAAQTTYETVDLGYDTVYTSSSHDAYQPKCWGDMVAYYQASLNPDTMLMEDVSLKVWSGGSMVNSIPVTGLHNRNLDISQNYVVFADIDPQNTLDADIYYSSATSNSPSKLVDTTVGSWYPAIDGSNVVFTTDDAPLRVKSIGSSLDVELPAGSIYSTDFDISGNNVVYEGTGTGDEGTGMYLFNIVTETNTRLIDYIGGNGMKISGDKVAYSVLTNFGNSASLYLLDINTKVNTLIFNGDTGVGAFDIDGNFVVWGSYIYDIQAQTTKMVAGYGSDEISAGGGSFAWYYEGDTTVVYEIRHAAFPAPGAAPPTEEPTPPPSDATHVLIGPDGGEIYVDDFHLQVYQDSLGESIEFYIVKPIVNNENILKPFEIKPDGVSFNPPAQISINITGTRADSGQELMHLVNGEWVPVEDTTTSTDGNSLIASITSTGTYALSEARQITSQVIDTVGGVVSIPDVSLDIPTDALAGSATVAVEEVFVEASNIAQSVSVDLGGAILSAPAQLSFNVPSGVDSATTQVGQLVNDAWVKVDSTVNSAGQIVANITEGGIYGLITTASSGITDIPFPSGMAVLAIMLSTGLVMGVARRKYYQK